MINNNNDRMSDILSFFRSSYFRSEEAGSVDPDLVKPLPEKPVDLLRRTKLFVAYGHTRIFQSKFSCQITGNEVLISYRKSDGKD
jgi:hypothetical protein